MKKFILLLLALMLFYPALADWTHGTARFKGEIPKCCLNAGGVRIWHNGSLRKVGVSGEIDIYEATGDVCVAYPANYKGRLLKIKTSGTVQIQYLKF